MIIDKKMLSKIAICIMSLMFFLFNLLSDNYTEFSNILTAIYVFAIFVYLTYISRKNILLFIVFFFITYCNYSILYGRYINPEIAMINSVIESSYVDGLGINILLLFLTTILMFLKPIKKIEYDYGFLMNENRSNKLISWGAFLVIILIGIFFYTPAIDGGRAGYSPLYEYSTIFFIIGFYYSGKRRSITGKALVVLLILYTIRDFIGGHRVTGLQLMIILFVFFFAYRTNYRKVLLMGFAGIVLMNFVAVYRSTFMLSSTSIARSFNNLYEKMFAFDTAYYAYLASLTFIATKPLYPIVVRLGQFSDFIVSQILVGTVGESLYEISRKYYSHANGGILPIYFFYYLGWLGTIISGLLVTIYFNLIESVRTSTLGLKKVILVYVVATVPRWYLYSPNQLIRGVILLIIVYYIAHIVDTIIPKKQKNTVNAQIYQKID